VINTLPFLDFLFSVNFVLLNLLRKVGVHDKYQKEGTGVLELIGEVDSKERSQMMRPGVVKPDPNEFLHIPVFRLRILLSSGKLVQVLYKGEPPGDADIGEQVIVKGVDRGGVLHARSIYNLTTNSWVTAAPGFIQKIFGDFF
jgi:hypothetical protein